MGDSVSSAAGVVSLTGAGMAPFVMSVSNGTGVAIIVLLVSVAGGLA